MPEVARCPICGKDPNKKYWDCDSDPSIYHCDTTFETYDAWNRYAAAMELAIATAAYFTLATEAGHKRLQEAGQRVLDVWK